MSEQEWIFLEHTILGCKNDDVKKMKEHHLRLLSLLYTLCKETVQSPSENWVRLWVMSSQIWDPGVHWKIVTHTPKPRLLFLSFYIHWEINIPIHKYDKRRRWVEVHCVLGFFVIGEIHQIVAETGGVLGSSAHIGFNAPCNIPLWNESCTHLN